MKIVIPMISILKLGCWKIRKESLNKNADLIKITPPQYNPIPKEGVAAITC